MSNKDLQIKSLTMALRDIDGLCDYCVGCQALGLGHSDDFSENDCLQSDSRGYDFVFDFIRVAREQGILTDETSRRPEHVGMVARPNDSCSLDAAALSATGGATWMLG